MNESVNFEQIVRERQFCDDFFEKFYSFYELFQQRKNYFKINDPILNESFANEFSKKVYLRRIIRSRTLRILKKIIYERINRNTLNHSWSIPL